MGQTTHQPGVLCSKYYFFIVKSCKKFCKNPFNLFFYFFYKNGLECPKSITNYEKQILGTSEAWLMSCFFHRPREPAYHIVDCRNFTPFQFFRPSYGPASDLSFNFGSCQSQSWLIQSLARSKKGRR